MFCEQGSRQRANGVTRCFQRVGSLVHIHTLVFERYISVLLHWDNYQALARCVVEIGCSGTAGRRRRGGGVRGLEVNVSVELCSVERLSP